ncbi:GNAT family N-acetyltransferase [Marinimicrobium sp. C2-29]|uniref:GNAT family N-acetyltransferase n=1 Tax=Marinimicrobium sp. C2-29 TaxID=3139825 RepID=UPI003138C847
MEIRLAKQEDAAQLAEYYSINREHFIPWEPTRETGYYSLESLKQRLSDYEKQHIDETAAHFLGLIEEKVVAHCSLTNIVYGPLQGCFMGYGVSKDHEGYGMMKRVCAAANSHAFQELGLNRVMANYMPRNTRSANLLRRMGFFEEGLARKYLKINGVWEDHVLTSKLNPEKS